MSDRRLHIAIVDDEADVLRALERLLRSAGHDARTYPGGEDFLRSVDASPPDCVVLDLQMPGISGFDVQARLARQQPRVPVIAMTGGHSEQARERALACGACAFLRKPVDGEALISAIECAAVAAQPAAIRQTAPSHTA